ncbi:MAG: Hpt domain-containing protein [Verrucomicrobia bacterium]|nr:Hpt domain-containing protein [Verrucomicrobiota bacterium]
MNNEDCIDPRALDRLRDLGGNGFLRQMIGLFLDLARRKIEEARAAERAGNIQDIEKAIHALRSSSGNVGACAMFDLATRIEQLARDRDAGRLPPLLRELEAAFAPVKTRLEKEKDSLQP